MINPNRLPPQPTDTALARLVRRLIDLLPGASIGRVRRLKDDLARVTYKKEMVERAYGDLVEAQYRINNDIQRLIPRIEPSFYISMRDYEEAPAMRRFQRMAVDFETFYVEFDLPKRAKSKLELHEYTKQCLEEACHLAAESACANIRAAMLQVIVEECYANAWFEKKYRVQS